MRAPRLRLVLGMSVVALVGCATTPPPMIVQRAESVRVEVPVAVPCIRADQIVPVPPSSMPPRTAGVAELANGAAADAIKYRALALEQERLLHACAKGTL